MRVSRTMLKRILSSLVGIPLLLFCVFWRGGLPFSIGITVVALVGVSEFYGACRKQGLRPLAGVGMSAVALSVLGSHSAGYAGPDRWSGPVLAGLVLIGLTAELAQQERAPLRNRGA